MGFFMLVTFDIFYGVMVLIKALPYWLIIFSTAISPNCFADPIAQRWAQVTKPSQADVAQSIGSYTAGCISGAASIPANGNGYQVMRPSRNRAFGHPDLKNFIIKLGQVSTNQHWGSLLIGDLGQARGGPTISGHKSHQTGLDVDIWFLLLNSATAHPLSTDEREHWSAPSVLLSGTDYLNPKHWSDTNERILAAAASMPEVDRIFVNPSIKKELCWHYSKEDWLRKIRPWWHHDDHFHVRLKCPSANPHCQAQEPLPKGNGCDSELAWWFTEEAKHPTPSKVITKPASLPKLCEKVLKQ